MLLAYAVALSRRCSGASRAQAGERRARECSRLRAFESGRYLDASDRVSGGLERLRGEGHLDLALLDHVKGGGAIALPEQHLQGGRAVGPQRGVRAGARRLGGASGLGYGWGRASVPPQAPA